MKKKILKSKISITNLVNLNADVLNYLKKKIKRKSFYICVSAVHSCIEAFKSKRFLKSHNTSDISVPDGRPLYWILRLSGYNKSTHLPGYLVTENLLKLSSKENLRIGIYGSTKNVIKNFKKVVKKKYNNLNIVFSQPHPHSIVSNTKHNLTIKTINKKKVDILFVCLGCPLQENWMYSNRFKLKLVMIGIGAAIDFISGNKLLAPKFLEKLGLAWLFRLITEPRRLFWRYFSTNFLFIFLFFLQITGLKKFK